MVGHRSSSRLARSPIREPPHIAADSGDIGFLVKTQFFPQLGEIPRHTHHAL